VAYDLREIEDTIHVGIHRYPSLPIVEKLGLKVKCTRTGAQAVDVLQPVRPFWMRVGLKDYLGQNLCWRADTKWQRGAHDPFYFQKPDPTDVAAKPVAELTDVGPGLVDRLESGSWRQRPRPCAGNWLREAMGVESVVGART